MPQMELGSEASASPEITRIPLLPDNYAPIRTHDIHQENAIEPVARPEISTVSADGTHIDSPSAMSDVTDNHAIELDPYDLTSKVTAAAKKMASFPIDQLREPGMIERLWSGLLDDLLGSRKPARA